MRFYFCFFIAVAFISCGHKSRQVVPLVKHKTADSLPASIGQVHLPDGYIRLPYAKGSFGYWLREQALKRIKTVYLYNGTLKKNQAAQYAVLDLPRSTTDLQQCADVVMRLRAEYLFAQKRYSDIRFTDYEGRSYAWINSSDRSVFEKYMANVFGWCGSASLEKQLQPVPRFTDIEAGDVLIRGGFPGHAVLVADMAVNQKGEKIFLLVQGYQPAQDMHLLVNPLNRAMSPWYTITSSDTIYTPEWVFYKQQLRRW